MQIINHLVIHVFIFVSKGGTILLGIPTIFDRAVQHLFKLVIKPITEVFFGTSWLAYLEYWWERGRGSKTICNMLKFID